MSYQAIQPTLLEKSGEKELSFSPEETGPGMWYILHVAAKEAITEEKKQSFLSLVDLIKRNHHCQTCRKHMEDFTETHPLENFWNIKSAKGEEIGCFLWTFIFHNSVNSRLGKKQPDWETAYNMYSNAEMTPCTAGCGEKKIESKPKFRRRERYY